MFLINNAKVLTHFPIQRKTQTAAWTVCHFAFLNFNNSREIWEQMNLQKGVGIPRKKQVGTHRICLLFSKT